MAEMFAWDSCSYNRQSLLVAAGERHTAFLQTGMGMNFVPGNL